MNSRELNPVWQIGNKTFYNETAFFEFLTIVQGLGESTARLYCRQVNYYLDWAKGKQFESVQTFREYVASMKESGFAASSINSMNSALRRWNVWRQGNHFELDKGMKHEQKLIRLVPYKVLKALEKIVETERDEREKNAILFLLYTGMRASEIVRWNFAANLNYTQLYQEKSVRVFGKNRKQREIPIFPKLRQWFNSLESDQINKFKYNNMYFVEQARANNLHGPEEYLRKILKEECERNNCEYYNPHAFRHTFATNLVANNVPLEKVARILGHSSTRVTEMYVHLQIEDLLYIETENGIL